jgi:hypothetical protein
VLVTGQLAEISLSSHGLRSGLPAHTGTQVDAVQVGRAHCRGSASTPADYQPPTEAAQDVRLGELPDSINDFCCFK